MNAVLRTLILLTLFSLPFYVVRFTVFGLPTTLLEVILLVTAAVWIIQQFIVSLCAPTHIPPSKTQPFLQIIRSWYLENRYTLNFFRWPTALFLTASIIAVLVSPQPYLALGHWRAFILEPILFALVLIDILKTNRDRAHVIYALASSLVIPVAVALYQQATGNLIPNEFWANAATRRVTSVYGYPNALGLYAVPILILIFSQIIPFTPTVIPEKSGIQAQKEKTKRSLFMFFSGSPIKPGMTMKRILLSILFLTTTLAIVFIRSKGALLALAVGIAVYCILIVKKKLLTVGAFIVIAAIGVFVFKDSLNLLGISTVQGGDSVSVRLTQYRETWEMLRDRPFTGAGLRGYQTAMVPYHKQNYIEIFMYPHNLFLAVWSELGLLGLIAFIWILITFFKSTYASICHSRESGNPNITNKQKTIFHLFLDPRSRSGMTAVAAAMVALLVHGLVDVPYFKNDLAVLFWTLIALPISRQAAPRNIEGIIGNYHEFFSEIMKRLAACSIDMKKLPVSHLCYRVASIQRYETVRDQLKPFCASMAEYEFNGRPDAILQLRNPLELSKGWQVSFIELPAPKTSHVYPEGLEHCGFVMGEELPAFHERNKSVLTGKKDHGPYCQPSFITFENGTTAKFYDRPLKEIVRLEGKQFISVS